MSAPKTFLQLAQSLRQEVGANGTGPTTVVSQTGEYKRLIDYIAAADEEIQQEKDQWRFMVKSFQINTVAGTMAYASTAFLVPSTDVRTWRDRTIKCYLLSAGKGDEGWLSYIDYEEWDATYNTGAQTNNRPMHWTIGNANELLIGPAPNGVYRITGEYMRTASTLTADSDTPTYPAEFHMLPVYLAMMKYGRFTGAGEVYTDGERLYNKMLNRMKRTQLPQFNHPRPLA